MSLYNSWFFPEAQKKENVVEIFCQERLYLLGCTCTPESYEMNLTSPFDFIMNIKFVSVGNQS